VRLLTVVILCLALLAEPLYASPADDFIWLERPEISKIPKNQGHKKRAPMSTPADFIIKSGSYPNKSGSPDYLKNAACWIKLPDNTIHGLEPEKKKGVYRIYDDAFQKGRYDLTVYEDMGVIDGVRYHLFAHQAFRNTGDEVEELECEKKSYPGMYNGSPAFELVDLTEDDGNDFSPMKKYTGDRVPFQVRFKGKPVSEGIISITTKGNWNKLVKIPEDGRIDLTLIKEIFHGEKINKEPQKYLVTAEYTLDRPGTLNGEPYAKEVFRTSGLLAVYPTPLDWKSKGTGYTVMMFTGTAVCFGAAVRRKRRKWYEKR
jgi:hypothetical protein